MGTFGKWFVGLLILFILIVGIGSCSNMVTEEKAMARFKEIAGTNDIVIVRSSNMTPFFGDPHDVSFELKIKGKRVSARCTSGAFSEMVCRLYDDED